MSLRWSCIGCPEGNASTKIHRTNLACTLFSRPHIFEEMNDSMKRFWQLGVQENGVKAMTREDIDASELVGFKIYLKLPYEARGAVNWSSYSRGDPAC